MCSIQSAVLAFQIGSTLYKNQLQEKAADSQTQVIQRNYEIQNAQTNQQYQQQNQQAQEQMSQRAKEAMVEQARLQTAFGESGLQAGGTDVRIANEASNNAATDISTIQNNLAKAQEQTHLQGMGNQAQAQSAYNSVRRPTLLGTGLQIGGYWVDRKVSEKQAADAALRGGPPLTAS